MLIVSEPNWLNPKLATFVYRNDHSRCLYYYFYFDYGSTLSTSVHALPPTTVPVVLWTALHYLSSPHPSNNSPQLHSIPFPTFVNLEIVHDLDWLMTVV